MYQQFDDVFYFSETKSIETRQHTKNGGHFSKLLHSSGIAKDISLAKLSSMAESES